MNRRRAWAEVWTPVILTTAVWLGGCTCAGSLRPLESDEPLAFTSDLSGKWVSNETDGKEQEYVTVESAGNNVYRVNYSKDGDTLKDVYELSLVQVGGYTFFDAAFKETGDKQSTKTAYDLGVLPIHFIGRVWADKDQLRLGLLDYNWMEKMSSNNSLTLPFLEHNEGDDHIILLTAESDKLKEFVRQYAEDPEAFSSVSTFHRAPTSTEDSSSTRP
jgi:hypothetical protein